MERLGHQRLNKINVVFGKREFQLSLQMAQQLKQELLEQDSPDPSVLGWARFYEFKSLYELGRHEETYALLNEPEPKQYVLSLKNSGYMYSVGAELATHLNLVDDVVMWGQRCLTVRLSSHDIKSALRCAVTVCNLLQRLDSDHRNLDFVHYLLAMGTDYDSEHAILHGYRYLLAHIEKNPDPHAIFELMMGIPTLQTFQTDEWHEESIALLKAIIETDWYEEALPPHLRQQHKQRIAFHKAVMDGDVREVGKFLKSGLPVDIQDEFLRTPLMKAAFSGHDDVVALLLSHDAGVDVQNIQRRTALVLAADQGQSGIVKQLIRAGASLNIPGILDQTALMVAAWQGHLKTVELLVEAGADIEWKDATGNTALTLSATEDQPDVVKCLLDFGAEIEAEVPHNQTALLKAAMHGQAQVTRVLVQHHANVQHKDSQHLTAADWAHREGYPYLAQWLQGEVDSSFSTPASPVKPLLKTV